MIQDRPIAVTAQNILFWFGDSCVSAAGPFPPTILPDFISIFIIVSKADQFGKGATRFFPADHSNPNCLTRWVYLYAKRARLAPTDFFFFSSSSPSYRIYSTALTSIMRLTASSAGINSARVSLHSLRVGGLVALFAAGVPTHLKQLAGRRANEKSFIAYARATMEQYGEIASALNNPHLVTCEHIRMIYSQFA
jgi:hypothetical protein